MVYLVLVFFGLALGSFVNALVWRVHQQNNSIGKKIKNQNNLSVLNGRSMCPNCKHELTVKDLLPVISWVLLGGKCRYCKRPISTQYPIVELIMAAVFVVSYYFWPGDLTQTSQQVLFVGWLLSSVGLLALAIYDLKWLILPNRILYPTFFIAALSRFVYIAAFSESPGKDLLAVALSVTIASGFFWLLFEYSKGKWIGFGDVRLGLVTGTLLADPVLALAMIFFASLLGTLAVLPGLITGNKKLTSQIPYGPFLIIACGTLVLFGDKLAITESGLLF